MHAERLTIVLLCVFLGACDDSRDSESTSQSPPPPPLQDATVNPLPLLDNTSIEMLPDYDQKGIVISANWPGQGEIRVAVAISDPNDPTIRDNYAKLRDRWGQFLPDALNRIVKLREKYEHDEFPIDLKSAYFIMEVPAQPYGDNPEWTFFLEEESGWVLDFVGWEVVGSQGVF